MDLRTGRTQWLTRLEWGVCIGATLIAVWLHVLYLTHAGGLWRDEASSVQLAKAPAVGEMWNLLGHDSFPVLFPAILRVWSAIGLGHSDLGLRGLGFGIGLLLLAALWLSARFFGFSRPFVSLGLLAVNLTLVRWGDSLRAFGLGCCLVVLTLGLVWNLMKKPGWKRFLAAALAGMLSVQCLYQNAFLLLAMCAAGCFVCFCCDQGKLGLAVLGVGVPAALSLLPYAGLISASQRWYVVEKTGFSAAMAWRSLSGALGNPMFWQTVVWIGLGLLALVWGVASLRGEGKKRRICVKEMPLFAAMTMGFSILGFVFFLVIAKLPTQPWYWLPLMVVVAVSMEAALASRLERYRAWRLALVLLMVCVPLPAGVKLARFRQTNIDLAAARLREQAQPDDFIVVYPWFMGLPSIAITKGKRPGKPFLHCPTTACIGTI
jgi:hypothetical protein